MAEEETGQDHAFWIKEAQRRDFALEKAKHDGRPPEELARLRAALEEADGHVSPPAKRPPTSNS